MYNVLPDAAKEGGSLLWQTIMLESTHFVRHVIGEVEGKNTNPSTCVDTATCSMSRTSSGGSRLAVPKGRDGTEKQYEWLVVWCLWNAVRLAEAEQFARLADRTHGAGSARLPCVRGTRRRVMQRFLGCSQSVNSSCFC